MSLSWGNCPLPPHHLQQSQLGEQIHSGDKIYLQRQQNVDVSARVGILQKQQPFSTSTVETYPYEPSIASSASSSVSSVFSDTASQTSSTSSTSQTENDEASSDRPNLQVANEAASTTFFPGVFRGQQQALSAKNAGISIQVPAPVPAEQRQHPRRCSLAGGQRPPPLVRQTERKVNFVDNLVGKLTLKFPWPSLFP